MARRFEDPLVPRLSSFEHKYSFFFEKAFCENVPWVSTLSSHTAVFELSNNPFSLCSTVVGRKESKLESGFYRLIIKKKKRRVNYEKSYKCIMTVIFL